MSVVCATITQHRRVASPKLHWKSRHQIREGRIGVVAAAHTVANFRSHLMDRTSHAPSEVTTNRTNLHRPSTVSSPSRGAYFLIFLSYPSSAATTGDLASGRARSAYTLHGKRVYDGDVSKSATVTEAYRHVPWPIAGSCSAVALVCLSTWNARGSALRANEAMTPASALCLQNLAPAAVL